jgi:tetratricopeptide (TPR) repeat protein
LKSDYAEAHYNLGNTLKELGRLDEAEGSYRQAIALKSDYAEAHSNLGVTLRELGRFGEAEASLRQATALKSDFVEAHSNLGNTLKELGRLDEAEASLRQAIALKSDFVEAHSNLGNTLKELGRLDEAEGSYRQAIALKSDYAEAHYNLGNTLKELGRLDKAEASYTQAIALKPNFTRALVNRWSLLFNKKQFEAALRDADLCISKGARELDLTTLYALGRVEEIYKRIETQSKIDGENISIAAFASFVAESEKKHTAYNFCPNPIDFIHFSNLSSHLNDSTAYITEVIEELDKVETIWEPSGNTTISGFQSLRGINLFKSPSGKIAQLKSIIIDELDAYYLKFHNESCSYIQKWPSGNNLFGWHVILKHQGYQRAHIHNGGWLSGVVYLKVVPSLGKDEGAIEFSLNGEYYSDVNSPKLTFQPESGDIVFFPSSLHHRTIPFTTDTDRIIVSFDLVPKASGH